MNPRLLIDAIVQQTTVLIAQLSTAAGLRSPLAHVADQVFVSLTHEIERQGISRKVAADMFGLALRTYQRKVQRLQESGSEVGRTLWEAILEHVTEHGPQHRDAIVARFRHDDELAVSAVLADLVTSGFVYSSGRGENAVYGATSEADRRALSSDDDEEALALMLWGIVFRAPGTTTHVLLKAARSDEARVRAALARLLADGRVTRDQALDDAPLRAATFMISPGAAQGWEAAVFDHYQALANGIAAKLRARAQGAAHDEHIGGSTLHFGIHPGHPYESRVLGLLKRMRQELDVFWDEVSQYNREHPVADEATTRVTFYFGQTLTPPADLQHAAAGATPASEEQGADA